MPVCLGREWDTDWVFLEGGGLATCCKLQFLLCRSTLQNKDGADGQGRDRSLGPERRTFRIKQGPEVVGSSVRPVGYYYHAHWN